VADCVEKFGHSLSHYANERIVRRYRYVTQSATVLAVLDQSVWFCLSYSV